MIYTVKKVIGMLFNANMIKVSNSMEYFDYIRCRKGIFSIPNFSDKFFSWVEGKGEKAVLDKASLCQKLMNNNEPYEKILEVIDKQPQISDFPKPTEEQAKEILLSDLNSKWIKRFIEVSNNKEEIIQALLSAIPFEITETGWHANLNDIDSIIPPFVNDSNLHVLIEYKNANAAFQNYLSMKYPDYSKYIEYMIDYMKYINNFGIKGKSKLFELCNGKLYLSPEYEHCNRFLKGEILISGAERIVKELAANMKCSKAEATKHLLKGRVYLTESTTLLRIICSEFHMNFPIRDRSWQTYRWWKNKKDSAEWQKIRTTYLPEGKVLHWKWIDRADEIKTYHIHNDNESPSVVMNRVFQESEEKNRANEEELKAKPNFPECPLKGNEEFKQVISPLELYHVGKAFKNCAFTYRKALEQGKTYIFISSDVCAEVCKDSNGKWRIQQCLGQYNSLLPKKVRRRFQKWFNNAVKSIAC
jgi:hypothetical protein